MPGFNGTGPEGRGAMTGRGMGPCGSGSGQGRGRGRGMGPGLRQGMGFGRGVVADDAAGEEDKLDAVMRRLDAMQSDMDALKQRLAAPGGDDAVEGNAGDGI